MRGLRLLSVCLAIACALQMAGMPGAAQAESETIRQRFEQIIEFDAWYGNSLDKVIQATDRWKNVWSGKANAHTVQERQRLAREILMERRGELYAAVLDRVQRQYSKVELDRFISRAAAGTFGKDPADDRMLAWVVEQMQDVQLNALFKIMPLVEARMQGRSGDATLWRPELAARGGNG